MKSGMVAAESVFEHLTSGDQKSVYDHVWVDGSEEPAITADVATNECEAYQSNMQDSWVYDELKQVRNFHGGFKKGALAGFVNAGIISILTKGKETWELRNKTPDSAKTKPVAECEPIEYKKPDGKLSFDLLSNLARSGTNHEDQHLDNTKNCTRKTPFTFVTASSTLLSKQPGATPTAPIRHVVLVFSMIEAKLLLSNVGLPTCANSFCSLLR